MEPGGGGYTVQIGPGGVQDGVGIVLVRSFFRLAVWVRFFDPLRLLLGPSWGALGPVLGCLELSWARFGAFRRTFWSLQLLSHLLCVPPALCFLLSPHGPWNFFEFRCALFHLPVLHLNWALRTARCAIKSAARTVGEG